MHEYSITHEEHPGGMERVSPTEYVLYSKRGATAPVCSLLCRLPRSIAYDTSAASSWCLYYCVAPARWRG